MTIGTWSIREYAELTRLLRSIETIQRKAASLSNKFNESHWPSEIATPIKHIRDAAEVAVHTIYRERGK